MRKITVKLEVNVTVSVDEGTEISDIVNELIYDFQDGTGSADIVDTEIIDYEVIDSK